MEKKTEKQIEELRELGFSEKAIEFTFDNSRVGEITEKSFFGKAVAHCGDQTTIYLKIRNHLIEEAKFQTTGCAAAQAAASALTDMITGKRLEEAEKVKVSDLLIQLGASLPKTEIETYISESKWEDDIGKVNKLFGVPPAKIHCACLSVEALKKAIKKA